MASKIETYEMVLAHGGRRDEAVVETVTIRNRREYDALCDRNFRMNLNLTAEMRAEKAYYGIRRAA